MDHLGACVGLLVIVGNRDGIEFALAVITAQDARWVFPCDGRACFHLGPHDFGAIATAICAFRHKVIDAADAVFIPRIPVLHRGIFHFGVFFDDDFNDRCVQLRDITLWCGTPFEVGHIGPFVRNDQCALKLACVFCVDAEIGAELHWATNTRWDVDK